LKDVSADETRRYREVQRRLLLLQDQFPDSPALKSVREDLSKRASGLVAEARDLEGQKKIVEATRKLEAARDIYPQLPGLENYYLRLSNKYPILYVGVHDLPEYFLPGLAFTDSEKQANELLFESLLKLTQTPSAGPRYEPGLAVDLPHMTPLGRLFRLTRNAHWSDGKLVSAGDVKNTVRLMSDPRWPGFIPEWKDLIEDGVRIEGDAYRVRLTLRQGVLDPLAMMNFKVLPQQLDLDGLAKFAQEPTCSGPYVLDHREGNRVVFKANPYYQARFDNAYEVLPRVQEIHFFRSANPAVDFANGQLHLLLDLPTRRYKELNSAGLSNVTFRQPVKNRRVYFLAVNHRDITLKNVDVRRAIAHAIDREKVLNACFREGVETVHRPLDGPYPPSSWACKPGPKHEPHNPSLAKACADRAKATRLVPTKLTLKYPADEGKVDEDDPIYRACKMIRDRLQELDTGIQLELVPLRPHELRRHVEEMHDYQLAYYHWDYPDDSYWLLPLFDPHADGKGGRNFLGYRDDAELEGYFRQAMAHRHITEVQKLTHKIHDRLYDQMPLIPLWQLDTHIAYHNSLALPAMIDPLLIFTDVEKWQLTKR
jgi:peptide/nickel transport system substrate-binding protein